MPASTGRLLTPTAGSGSAPNAHALATPALFTDPCERELLDMCLACVMPWNNHRVMRVQLCMTGTAAKMADTEQRTSLHVLHMCAGVSRMFRAAAQLAMQNAVHRVLNAVGDFERFDRHDSIVRAAAMFPVSIRLQSSCLSSLNAVVLANFLHRQSRLDIFGYCGVLLEALRRFGSPKHLPLALQMQHVTKTEYDLHVQILMRNIAALFRHVFTTAEKNDRHIHMCKLVCSHVLKVVDELMDDAGGHGGGDPLVLHVGYLISVLSCAASFSRFTRKRSWSSVNMFESNPNATQDMFVLKYGGLGTVMRCLNRYSANLHVVDASIDFLFELASYEMSYQELNQVWCWEVHRQGLAFRSTMEVFINVLVRLAVEGIFRRKSFEVVRRLSWLASRDCSGDRLCRHTAEDHACGSFAAVWVRLSPRLQQGFFPEMEREGRASLISPPIMASLIVK